MSKKENKLPFFKGIAKTWRILHTLADRKKWLLIVIALFFSLVECYSKIFQPYVITQIFDSLENGELTSLYKVCAICGGIVLVFFVICYINNVYFDWWTSKIVLSNSRKACRRLSELPFDTLNKRFKEEEMVNRIDFNALINLTSPILRFGNVIANTVSILYLFSMFAGASYILLIIVAVVACWGIIFSKIEISYRKKYEQKIQKIEDHAGGVAYDMIHRISFAQMFNCREHIYAQYVDTRKESWLMKWKTERLSIFIPSMTELFTSSMRGILGGILLPLYRDARISTGGITSSFSVYSSLSSAIVGYSSPFIRINTSLVNVQRLDEILSTEPASMPDAATGNTVVKTENISYSFDDRRILKGVDVEIREGEKVALIGRNGCGKSTLLRVLAGLYQPETGKLELKRMAEDSERSISYIPASSMLYNETVRSNIEMNGDGDVEKLLKSAQINTEQENLTEVMAETLSGGQAQRVNIARGLANRTQLLLADEPTSGLSISQGEAVIKGILSESDTVVVVTHHPAQLRFFTRVILMEDGKIVCSDTPDAIAAHSAFKRWLGELPEDVH